MKRPVDDPDLEQAFAAARHEDHGAEPSFSTLWAAAEARRRPGPERQDRPRFLAATAAAAGLLAVFLALWRMPLPAPAPPAISQWRPATDFLLETPGHELLGETPRLGRGFAITPPPTSSTDRPRRPS